MRKLKEIAKKLPLLPSLYRWLRYRYAAYKLQSKSAEQIFIDIYNRNAWRGRDSISGSGSDVYQTRVIIKELPVLFCNFGISTMLDIPCGDFHWMKNVDLREIDYTGADIVAEMIHKDVELYGRDGVCFKKLDLINDSLPKVDLVLCRDCLVHFSFVDIFRALENICNSQSRYLLTTTFSGRDENRDIVTGWWRPLNFEVAPLMLPKPLRLIVEGCTEGSGAYRDKSLGLWKIADVRESLRRRRI